MKAEPNRLIPLKPIEHFLQLLTVADKLVLTFTFPTYKLLCSKSSVSLLQELDHRITGMAMARV